jgi:hypothetical protein
MALRIRPPETRASGYAAFFRRGGVGLCYPLIFIAINKFLGRKLGRTKSVGISKNSLTKRKKRVNFKS